MKMCNFDECMTCVITPYPNSVCCMILHVQGKCAGPDKCVRHIDCCLHVTSGRGSQGHAHQTQTKDRVHKRLHSCSFSKFFQIFIHPLHLSVICQNTPWLFRNPPGTLKTYLPDAAVRFCNFLVHVAKSNLPEKELQI